MSVFNGGRYLHKAIVSILKQTFKDFELLIINDGSKDNTQKILESFNDHRIRVFNNRENIGLTKSLNKGVLEARGEYIARQDYDDISSFDRLEEQVNFLDTKKEYGLVGCWCYKINSKDKIIGKLKFPTEHMDILIGLLQENQFVHSSVMFRKECIEKVGSYNEGIKYAQDYDLWLRISEHYKVANIAKYLHLWRIGKNGISYSKRKEQEIWRDIIRERFLKKVIKNEVWQNIVEQAFKKNKNKSLKKYIKEITYHKLLKGINEIKEKKLKVIGIVSAYNEEDVISQVLTKFINEGIGIYFIDHHSTDNTMEIAKSYLGKGVEHVEIFPEECGYSKDLKDIYAWRYILKRKEELHSILKADWYIHLDADAVMESPWENITLLDAIKIVDSMGYNCINFELFNFRPVREGYEKDLSLQEFFNYWEPADYYDEVQIKCWKNINQKIDLVSSGGHNVLFEGRKIFPIKFIEKHYPIRSQEHATKKIFSERFPRFDISEIKSGWHIQYDRYLISNHAKYDPEELLTYDEKIVKNIYLQMTDYFDKVALYDELRKEIQSIYNSPSWKIGKFTTYPYRILKNFKIKLNSILNK